VNDTVVEQFHACNSQPLFIDRRHGCSNHGQTLALAASAPPTTPNFQVHTVAHM